MTERTTTRPTRITDDEDRLIRTLRSLVDLGVCDSTIARRLRDLVMADDDSPYGRWLLRHGFREQPLASGRERR